MRTNHRDRRAAGGPVAVKTAKRQSDKGTATKGHLAIMRQALLRNYEDTRCGWGYITLCFDCHRDAVQIEGFTGRVLSDHPKEGEVFPKGKCEHCGAVVRVR